MTESLEKAGYWRLDDQIVDGSGDCLYQGYDLVLYLIQNNSLVASMSKDELQQWVRDNWIPDRATRGHLLRAKAASYWSTYTGAAPSELKVGTAFKPLFGS